jgi:hypothetical protein
MVASKKSARIGIIAEERNDVEVLYEYTSKLIGENAFSFVPFIGHGCGKLQRKCRAWAANLIQRGCELIVVMHDSDGKDAEGIKASIEEQLRLAGTHPSIILVPVEELEAWLLSDADAIASVFNMKKPPRIPSQPETISDPKEHLGKLVSRNSKSQYLNTVHNRKIASVQKLESLTKCPSFSPYPDGLKKFLEKQ